MSVGKTVHRVPFAPRFDVRGLFFLRVSAVGGGKCGAVRTDFVEPKLRECGAVAHHQLPYMTDVETLLSRLEQIQNAGEDFAVTEPSGRRLNRLLDTLHPASMVGKGSVLLGKRGRRKNYGGVRELRTKFQVLHDEEFELTQEWRDSLACNLEYVITADVEAFDFAGLGRAQ